MAVNLSGLNGRNVMFWKMCVPIKAYIIKYTQEGRYYALNKRNGQLYMFQQHTCVNLEGDSSEVVKIKKVKYSEVEQYGIMLDQENWKNYIDFNHKNKRWDSGDTLDLIRDILRLGALGLFLLGNLALAIFSNIETLLFPILLAPPILITFGLLIGRPKPPAINNSRRAEKKGEGVFVSSSTIEKKE